MGEGTKLKPTPKKRGRGRPPTRNIAELKKRGQPTKLTDEVQGKILTFLRAGCYIETAVTAAGVHRDTFYTWLKNKSARHVAFSKAIEGAMAEAELLSLGKINKAASGVFAGDGSCAVPPTWQAAAWILERRHPDRWGRKDRVVSPPPGDKPEQPVINVHLHGVGEGQVQSTEQT